MLRLSGREPDFESIRRFRMIHAVFKKKKKKTTERLEEFTGVTIYKLLLDWQYRQSKVIRDGY